MPIEIRVEDIHEFVHPRGGHFLQSKSQLEIVEEVEQFSKPDASRAIEVEVVKVALCEASEFRFREPQSAIVTNYSVLGRRRQDVDAKSSGQAALPHLLASLSSGLLSPRGFGLPHVGGEVALRRGLVEGRGRGRGRGGAAGKFEEAEVGDLKEGGLGGTKVLVALWRRQVVGGWLWAEGDRRGEVGRAEELDLVRGRKDVLQIRREIVLELNEAMIL